MAITYSIEFAAAVARLEQNTRAGSRSVKKMADQMESSARFARNALIALAGALGVGSFGAAIRGASEAADAAAKMSDRFGIATQALIGMQHAGNLAGVSQEAMTTGLRTMAKTAVDAAQGMAEYERSYKLLNINAKEFLKLPMEQQFSTIIQRLGEVENVTLRNALAQDLLGRSGGEMLALAAEGSEAFASAARDAEAWGLAVNRVDAAKLEMANDAITRAQAAAKGLFTTIAINVAPLVKGLADLWSDTAAEARGFRQEAGRASEMVITGIGYAANVVTGLKFAYTGVKLVVAELLALAAEGVAKLVKWLAEVPKWAEFLPGPLGNAARAVREFGSEASGNFALFAESARDNVGRIKEELDKLAEEGLPKDRLIAKLREIRKLMQAEAEEIARKRQEFLKGAGADVDLGGDGKDKKEKKDTGRERIEKMIEQLREENMVELELLDEKLREKNLLLQDALDYGLITEEAALAQSALVQKKYEEQKTKIIDEETKRRYGISNVYRRLDLQSASGFFGQMATMMDSSSKAAFNIGKASAISQTIIDTYRAAQGAFAALAPIPFIGPVLGAAAAAAAIIAGMARVRSIKSQQFGAGGGATATYSANPTTGTPTAPISPLQSTVEPPQQAQAAQKQRVDITFVGGEDRSYSYNEVANEILPLINEAAGNGLEITVRTA